MNNLSINSDKFSQRKERNNVRELISAGIQLILEIISAEINLIKIQLHNFVHSLVAFLAIAISGCFFLFFSCYWFFHTVEIVLTKFFPAWLASLIVFIFLIIFGAIGVILSYKLGKKLGSAFARERKIQLEESMLEVEQESSDQISEVTANIASNTTTRINETTRQI